MIYRLLNLAIAKAAMSRRERALSPAFAAT
jgi:hypothetical protein